MHYYIEKEGTFYTATGLFTDDFSKAVIYEEKYWADLIAEQHKAVVKEWAV